MSRLIDVRPAATSIDPTPPAMRGRSHRVLVGLELGTGASALVCGALLVARPDGSLLGLPLRVLADTSFTDWRLPGALLAGLVGGGWLIAGAAQGFRARRRRDLSVVAGAGLVLFEAVEWAWLGFHPLQAVFMVVGSAVVVLALRADRADGAATLRDDVP